ncbi:MAG: PAS domain S-box protein [Verrucomicrobiota bacterium]
MVSATETGENASLQTQVESVLQKSEEQFRALFENAPIGIGIVDAAGNLLVWNAALLEPGGYSREDLRRIGNLAALYHDPKQREEILGRFHKQGVFKNYPAQFKRKDGSPYDALLSMTRTIFNGQPCNQVMIVDITEHKGIGEVQTFLAQTSRGTTEEPFFNALARYLAKSLGMDFVCIDHLEGDGLNARTVALWHDGHFEDNVTYALKDTPCGDVVGKEVCCFPASVCQFFPRDQVLWDLHAESYVGVTLWGHTGQPIGLIAVIGRKPLANRSLAEAMLKMVAVRAAGELERLASEEALRESENLLRESQVIAGLGSYVLNVATGLWKSSEVLDKLFGIDKAYDRSVAGWTALIHSEDRSMMLDHFKNEVLGRVRPFNKEYRIIRHNDQAERWVHGLGRLEFDAQGRPLKMHGTIQDITERKQADAEKEKLEIQNRQFQKSESLGRMAGAIAHHFNNQLHAVMGYLEMTMSELPRDSEFYDNLNEAMQSARKAAEVSREMVTYLGLTPVNRTRLDFSEVCQRHLPVLRFSLPQGMILQAVLALPGPAIQANANQMQQVLTNLVVNAWEAMGDARGVICLTVKTVSAADIPAAGCFPIDWQPQFTTYACLEVADAGCGIADQDIEKLFDPFFSSKFAGRGMGLAVVLGIVRAHNGAITVESKLGQGSVFRVFLPLSEEAVVQPPR